MQYRFLGEIPSGSAAIAAGQAIGTGQQLPGTTPIACGPGESLVDVGGDYPVCLSANQQTAFAATMGQQGSGGGILDFLTSGPSVGGIPIIPFLVVGAILFLVGSRKG